MEANLELLQGGMEMLLLLLLIVLIIMILVMINIILLLMMIILILKHGFTDDYEYASHENATAAADPEQVLMIQTKK